MKCEYDCKNCPLYEQCKGTEHGVLFGIGERKIGFRHNETLTKDNSFKYEYIISKKGEHHEIL